VHTHLSDTPLNDDDLTDLALLRLDLMAAITMTANGDPIRVHWSHVLPGKDERPPYEIREALQPNALDIDCLSLIQALERELTHLGAGLRSEVGIERALLVSISTQSRQSAKDSLMELTELCRTAGLEVVDAILQLRKKADTRFLIGKGKLQEITIRAMQLEAEMLIFDQELNPSQIRSITDHTELRVVDRTQLILDIFARRARSREGKLQIEMAQLKYMLPRLTMRDDALSRLTGGIGGRGPGETRLEIDRRRINDRLTKLAKKLQDVARERHQRRSRRRKKDLPVLSLVGYTNAGKSTLLNALTKSDILAEDKLFATLDPTSRRLKFPEDIEVIITDTVGFIRNLPDELLQAFQATLEELHEADVLLHVIDVSNPRFEEQLQVVEELLEEMGLGHIATIRILNKADLAEADLVNNRAHRYDAVAISAFAPETFPPLLERARALVIEKWRQGGRLPADASVEVQEEKAFSDGREGGPAV